MVQSYDALVLPGCEAESLPVDRPPVHPVAALFPMMTAEELAELAADIQANGQVYPIMLDADGQLVDGRNRQAACRLAGVEPRYETLPVDTDLRTYILSTNITRRHLNQGQRAMLIVLAGVTPCNGSGEWTGLRQTARETHIAAPRLAEAWVVWQHTPDLADAVRAGAMGLNEAVGKARRVKEAKDAGDQAGRLAEEQLARLRAGAPELADLVVEGRMDLSDGIAALDKREREEQERRERRTRYFADSVVQLFGTLFGTPETLPDDWLSAANPWAPDRNPAGAKCAHLWTADGLRDLAGLLTDLATTLDARGGRL